MLLKNGILQFQIHNSFHEGYNESEEGICPSMAGQSVIKCIWDCCRQSRSRCNLLKYSFLFLFIKYQYFSCCQKTADFSFKYTFYSMKDIMNPRKVYVPAQPDSL